MSNACSFRNCGQATLVWLAHQSQDDGRHVLPSGWYQQLDGSKERAGQVTDMGWHGAWDGYIEEEIQLMRVADENAALAWCTEHFGADGRGFFESNIVYVLRQIHSLVHDPGM